MTIHSNHSRLIVPAMLYGPKRQTARSRFRTIARRAAKSICWHEALSGVEFISIEEVKGDFSCGNSSALLFTGDNLWLDVAFEEIYNACDFDTKEFRWAEILSKLFVSGLDQFWFALCICTASSWLPIPRTREEKMRDGRACLEKLLLWWPTLCLFNHRFSMGQKTENLLRGWPRWSGGLANMCGDLGLSYEEIRRILAGPEEAGRLATQWLSERKNIS